MKRDTKRTSLLALAVASGFLIQIIIWLPEVSHYHVNEMSASPSVVDAAISAQDRRLDRAIRQIDFGLKGHLSEVQTLLAAELMLNGKLDFPGFDSQEVSWPFDETHLLLGGPTFQLKMAGLAWIELALDAWRLSGEDKFLDFAIENTLRFARYESGQFLPTGYLWNDHALANRAIVYASLWGALVSTGRLDRSTVIQLLSAVDRTAKLLAKPAHYTFRTNHGVMQNIGLIAIAAAFPWLDEKDKYLDIGYERLARQMDFFVSRQGVVLEHSTGYHEFGVSLLGTGFDLLEEMSMPAPVAWQEKLQRSREFLRLLTRPDNSIPNFGDSEPSLGKAGREILDDLANADDGSGHFGGSGGASVFVDAGYAIFRPGPESETGLSIHAAATWSKFVSDAHKHADEFSVHYWVNGTSLWQSSGYWPYGLTYRDVATGWSGSNAPHFVGEKADGERSSYLAGVGEDRNLSVWDFKRQGEEEYTVSRLVILSRGAWGLVVDSAKDPMSRSTEIIWGTSPQIRVSSRAGQTTVFKDTRSGLSIGVAVDGPASLDWDLLRGSTEPFAGWVASQGRVNPSWAIRIVTPANTGVATAWGLLSGSAPSSVVSAEIMEWSDEQHWSVGVVVGDTRTRVDRAGSELIYSSNDATPFELEIREPSLDQSLSAEVEAYLVEASVPDTYRDYLPWRWMLSEICSYLFLGLLVVIVLVPKRFVPAIFKPGAFAIVAGSSLLGAYIHFVYFAV